MSRQKKLLPYRLARAAPGRFLFAMKDNEQQAKWRKATNKSQSMAQKPG